MNVCVCVCVCLCVKSEHKHVKCYKMLTQTERPYSVAQLAISSCTSLDPTFSATKSTCALIMKPYLSKANVHLLLTASLDGI